MSYKYEKMQESLHLEWRWLREWCGQRRIDSFIITHFLDVVCTMDIAIPELLPTNDWWKMWSMWSFFKHYYIIATDRHWLLCIWSVLSSSKAFIWENWKRAMNIYWYILRPWGRVVISRPMLVRFAAASVSAWKTMRRTSSCQDCSA